MKNKTIAYLGIFALIFSWIAYQLTDDTGPDINQTLINISFGFVVLFVILAAIQLWKSNKLLVVLLAISTVGYLIILSGNDPSSTYLFIGITNGIGVISTILAIVKLFKVSKLTPQG